MIRREVEKEFYLITQHDHALLAGELAGHVGNKLFEQPRVRRESFITGVAQHDCGWPVHDDRPTVNPRGKPIDVFESTPELALTVWQASVDRALAMGDDYAALLVCLHVLALSVFATTTTQIRHEKFDLNETKTRFEVNRFQHKQIELIEALRRKLQLPVDVPMRQGLVESPTEPAELLLQYHFRLLQAMDLISLALCCTTPPTTQIRAVPTHPGGKSVTLNLSLDAPTVLRIGPWPFEPDRVQVSVPYRPVEAIKYPNETALRSAYNRSPESRLSFELLPG